MIDLTDATAKTIAPPEAGNRIVYDTKMPGFGLRVTKAGAKSWVLNYRAAGRERRLTIGSYPAWKASAARDYAKALRREIDQGRDPLAIREAAREAPTLTDLCEQYMTYAQRRKRSRSLAEDRKMWDGVILPEIGTMKVEAVKRSDISSLFEKVSAHAPIRANRTMALLSRAFNLAIREFGIREAANPVLGVERNPENRRERHLTPEELSRLLTAVTGLRNKQSANAIRIALLTGARRGEILGATWDQFDLEAGEWIKPASVTKQKKLHRVPLNGPVRTLLAEMREAADVENAKRAKDGLAPLIHLFPGAGEGGAQGDLKKSWAVACKEAGLSGFRFHDLRHSFASFLVSSGHNLALIGALLGHASPQTTARYAHLLMDPQRQATDRVGSIFTAATANGGGASVSSLPRRHA